MATKPTYQELKAQAAKLMEQAEELRREEVAAVTKEFATKLNDYEITLADLVAAGYAFAGARGAVKERKARSTKTATVPMKYRDPANASNEWSGRGRNPKWLQEYLAAGKQAQDFLIR